MPLPRSSLVTSPQARRRGGYVALVVVLGFLLATNPRVAEAAAQITGAQIKNDTITSADVKNRSLLGVDFKRGQLPRGARGPAGPRGVAGPPGLQGAPGPQGVVRFESLSGPVGTVSLQTSFQFVGATTTVVTTSADQVITGGAVLPLGTQTGIAIVGTDLCYQSEGGSTVPFRGPASVSYSEVDTTREAIGVFSSVRLPAGSYVVGPCVRGQAPHTLDDNDYANGWVAVLDAPQYSGAS